MCAAFHWSSGKTRQNGAVIKLRDVLPFYCSLSLVFREDETDGAVIKSHAVSQCHLSLVFQEDEREGAVTLGAKPKALEIKCLRRMS